jgi:hypothetical protein
MFRCLFFIVISLFACSSKGDKQSALVGDSPGAGGEPLASTAPSSAASSLAHALSESDRKLLVPASKAGVIFEGVKYSKDTLLVEGDALAALTTRESKTHSYTFSKSKAAASHLVFERGKVLLIAGLALRRITEVSENGDSIVVKTEFASLADAIVEGKVGWKTKLSMSPDHITALLLPDGRELPVGGGVKYATLGNPLPLLLAPKLEWEFADGPLTYKLRLTPKQESIGIKVQLTRALANSGSLAYTATGTIRPLEVDAQAVYKEGKVKSFDYVQDQVGGDFELKMAAAGGGKMEISKDVPGLRLKWVILVGPIPVVITATAKIVGRVTLPAKGSSTAEAKFSFRGKGGFHFDGGSVKSEFGMAKQDFDAKPFDAAGFINQSVDNQFGVAFPIVKVGLFDSFLIPRFLTGATLGVRLSWGPVCKEGYMKISAKAGYDFEVLGVKLAGGDDKPLYVKEKRAKQEGCKD